MRAYYISINGEEFYTRASKLRVAINDALKNPRTKLPKLHQGISEKVVIVVRMGGEMRRYCKVEGGRVKGLGWFEDDSKPLGSMSEKEAIEVASHWKPA